MIYDQAYELARALRTSPEYQEFKAIRKKVEQNSESLKMLQDFQAKQVEIQTMQMLGKEISPEKRQEYEKMSELLNFHPTVREYLQAEYKLARIMGDIQKILAEALDLKQSNEKQE